MPDNTTAYNLAGTGENNAGVGTVAWTNPGNVTADDGSYATNEPGAGATTNYHVARNFGFTTGQVPDAGAVLGYEVEWRYLKDSGAAVVVTTRHRLWNSGVIGTEKTTSGDWPTTETALTKGGAGDTWDASLTPSQVRNAAFGVAIWAETDAEVIPSIGNTLKLDSVRMRVTVRMASFRQLAFRFYNDDGNQASQTAIADLNTDITWPLDTPFNLRIETEEYNNGDHDTGFTLQVSRNGGAYVDISGTSPARYHNTANLTQADDTTARLNQSTNAFLSDNNGVCDTGGVSTDKGPYNLKAIEHLHCLTASSAVCSNGDTLDFRMRYTAGTYQSYILFPRVTVGAVVKTGTAVGTLVVAATVQDASWKGQSAVGNLVVASTVQSASWKGQPVFAQVVVGALSPQPIRVKTSGTNEAGAKNGATLVILGAAHAQGYTPVLAVAQVVVASLSPQPIRVKVASLAKTILEFDNGFFDFNAAQHVRVRGRATAESVSNRQRMFLIT